MNKLKELELRIKALEEDQEINEYNNGVWQRILIGFSLLVIAFVVAMVVLGSLS